MSLFAELAAAFQAGAKPPTTRKQPKTKRPFRPNPWPKCRQPGCYHRIDPGSVHLMCGRAWDYGVALPPTHPLPCCPGECRTCHYCIDHCEYLGDHPKDGERK